MRIIRKNVLMLALAICMICVVVSCGNKKELNGKEILGNVLYSIESVVYHAPNETSYIYDDADEIEKISDILGKQTYTKQEDSQELVEGNYMLDLVGEETLEIGLSGNILIYDGKYYIATDEDAFEEIYAILQ